MRLSTEDTHGEHALRHMVRKLVVFPDFATVLSMAALAAEFLVVCTQPYVTSGLMMGDLYDYDDVELRIDPGASMHFISDISLFT